MAIVSLTSLLVLMAKWCSSGECDNHDADVLYTSLIHLYSAVFRSRGVATISATGSFNPDKINILDKPCDINGRKHSCFNTRLCFSATFRPNNPVGPVGKRSVHPLLLATRQIVLHLFFASVWQKRFVLSCNEGHKKRLFLMKTKTDKTSSC